MKCSQAYTEPVHYIGDPDYQLINPDLPAPLHTSPHFQYSLGLYYHFCLTVFNLIGAQWPTVNKPLLGIEDLVRGYTTIQKSLETVKI